MTTECKYPNNKKCESDDCSDECQRKRAIALAQRERDFPIYEITSMTTVRLFRDRLGTVIANTEAVGMTRQQAEELFVRIAPMYLHKNATFGDFFAIVRAVEKQLGIREPQ